MNTHKLIKVKSDHNNVRDDVVECEGHTTIKIGAPVMFYAKSRDFDGGLRIIETSPVVAFVKLSETLVEIKTASGSVYRIEEL